MITEDGAIVALQALAEVPMELRLYSNSVKGRAVVKSAFSEPSGYEVQKLSRDDWELDTKNLRLVLRDRTISFSKRIERIVGWFLLAEDEGVVIAYEPFEESYTAYNERFKLTANIALKLVPIEKLGD